MSRFDILRQIGCIVCRKVHDVWTEPEMHHIRDGQGMGQRADDEEAIPLCHPHHRTGGYGVAYHAGRRAWEREYGTERELLAEVDEIVEVLRAGGAI